MVFRPIPSLGVASTLFLEAFGSLVRDPDPPGPAPHDEDLYSVFMARAELMSWAGGRPRPLLWGIEEAELTAGDAASRIGFVQVGLEPGVEAATTMPALLQCFDDALRRFGSVEVAALQLTALSLHGERQSARELRSSLNRFHAAHRPSTTAVLAFGGAFLVDRSAADLLVVLQRSSSGGFVFGPLVTLTEQQAIAVSVGWGHLVPAAPQSGLGLRVTLPEWTASAAA